MRRPVSEQPLDLRRSADRSSGIGSKGEVQPRIAPFTGTRAGGRGRRVLIAVTTRVERGMVVHPIGRSEFAIGKLRSLHLPYNDRAGINQSLDWDGVGACRWVK